MREHEIETNMTVWNNVRTPPPEALKKILGGRLAGKTDISPQWRYEIMTKVFGACGFGWKYIIEKTWTTEAPNGQIFAFAQVVVFYKSGNSWSEPIQGIGGSMLVVKEKSGLYANDEGYKMAVTDALSVALKMIGVAADIYAGKWDGTRYVENTKPANKPPAQTKDEKRTKQISQEFFNYTTEHKDELPDDYEWDEATFVRITKEGDPKTVKDFKNIVKNIPVKLVSREII